MPQRRISRIIAEMQGQAVGAFPGAVYPQQFFSHCIHLRGTLPVLANEIISAPPMTSLAMHRAHPHY
jgi:hypothetical protein